MTALPPKADMCSVEIDVRLVPLADILSGRSQAYFQGLSSALMLTGSLDP
jgi:hypothetical protein